MTMSPSGRTMTFRVTVRDNRSGGGGVSCDDLTVTVAPSAGPFRVTFPDATPDVQSGVIQVTWDVAASIVLIVAGIILTLRA